MKRHANTRAAITKALKEKGEPMTAEEIYRSIDVKRRGKRVSNSKAVSNLLKGMKNIRVIKAGFTVRGDVASEYKVHSYVYDDEGAEI